MHSNRGVVVGTAIAGLGMTLVLALLAFGAGDLGGATGEWWLLPVVAAGAVVATAIALAPDSRSARGGRFDEPSTEWITPRDAAGRGRDADGDAALRHYVDAA